MHSKATPRRVSVKGHAGIYYSVRADGRRAYEFDYRDSTGRRRWQVVDGGLRDAIAAREELRTRKRRGERIAPTRATLAELVPTWLAAQSQLRPRTRETYEAHLRVHVLPRLGRVRLAELSEDDVAGLITDLRAAGKAPWTIHGVLTPLSSLLNFAVRRGLIAANPVRRLSRGERPSAVNRRERRVLTAAEVGALLEASPPAYRPLLATAAYTGLRLGELLGLVWRDVDFEGGFLRVRKQLDRHGRRVEPKVAGAIRDVVLMPALARLLREHRLASGYSGPEDAVFASAAGTPLGFRNVARRGLERAVKRAGLDGAGRPPVTMHSLRHTFASHLILDLKLDVVQVSRQLGHARPSITSDTYAHLFDQARHADEIRRRMAESAYGTVLEHTGGETWRNPAPAPPAEVAVLQGVRQ